MATISQSISTFPVPLPDRANQTRAEFSNNVDVFLSKINDHVEEENAWAGQANAVAVEVSANTVAAKTYRDEAQASQNATEYNGATTYDHPDTVIGSNGHAYRCLIDATVGDDPVGSVTGHWAQVTTGSTEVFDSQLIDREVFAFAFAIM